MDRRVVTVFGGSGFIGRHLIQRLAGAGLIVRAGVRDPEAANFLKTVGDPGQVVPLYADVTEPRTVEKAVAGAEWVVNLVGILYQRGRRSFQRMHVEAAGNIAKASAAAGVERLVQMSALGAAADAEAEYARTKAAGEEAAKRAFSGVSVTRPSVVFGPEDDFFNRFAAMARLAPVLPIFPTRFQPVYVGDVADAIVRILENAETGGRTYELGGPRVMTFREVIEVVLRETGRHPLLVNMPFSVATFEAFFLNFLPVPPLTPDQVKLLKKDNVVSPGAATLADLGITPQAVEAIVPTYLHRFRTQVMSRRRLI
ncbi:MAG: complex I NDUFA9 subunit family protein [Rhodospirillales bacterium]